MDDVDLFVIGGGSGGVRAARIAAEHGAKVMIAEEFRFGGTCVIRGCVPKKLLVYASRFARDFDEAAGYGWTVPKPSFDWNTLIANKDREIARLESAYIATLEAAGVAVIKSRALLEEAHVVRLLTSGARIRARYVLVATGSHPGNVAIPGIEHVISSNEAFHLADLPRRILIYGSGYIAVEFAGIFAGLGAEVALVCRAPAILRGFDDDVRTHLRREMETQGISVLTQRTVTRIDKSQSGLVATLNDGHTLEADQVMFALGRRPNVSGFGLAEAGVTVAETGGIAVDEFSRTSVPHIYAVGDVTNRINLTPVAIREGHAFADTVFGDHPTAVDHTNVPTAVFSEPEVGAVGLTEAMARARLGRVDIYRRTFRPMRATLSGRDTQVLIKLVVDGATDAVVGCHVVGPDASELIQVLGIAVKMGARKADFDATIAVHPTAAEELVTIRTQSARYVKETAG
ncbi:MAG TPA: glutathione-disulfide reductase [Xanthobacteraceae bacterium]|nr:glutathione-disulfide reductase [Xanthobacteraceae bacterium]